MAICCNRRECEQNTLTRHIYSCLHACLTVSHVTLAQGAVRVMSSMFHALEWLCVWFLFDCPFCTLQSLSHLLLHPPNLYLHLLCGSVRREVLCELPRVRSLTLRSTTILSQVMSPNSSTTTTSQRPLKCSSGSPPATAGPRTYKTRRLATTPSAERSLHHCSFKSEKNQRAVDKPVTLMKKVCCQLSPFSRTQKRRDPYTN